MNYNYTQPQFQQATQLGYGGAYKPMPQYPQWPVTSNIPQQVRPVSSIDEVRACPIDFDGSVFYFPDLANRKIYTKQINLDGTAILNAYELVEKPIDSGNDFSKFVTRDELNQLLAELKAPAKSKVDPLSF